MREEKRSWVSERERNEGDGGGATEVVGATEAGGATGFDLKPPWVVRSQTAVGGSLGLRERKKRRERRKRETIGKREKEERECERFLIF